MDDERIERALRQGPPDEPVYTEMASQLLESELTGRPVLTDRPSLRRPADRRGWWWQARSGLVGLAAAVVAGVAILGSVLVPGGFLGVGGPGPAEDALERIRAAGRIRIAITDGPPQVAIAGGSFSGLDVDVAAAIAESLGLERSLSFASAASLLDPTGTPTWDLTFPSRAVAADGTVRTSTPYYHWPVYLVVPAGSALTSIDDLAGRRVCAVEGTIGADWLDGKPTSAASGPPPIAQAVVLPDDAACLTALDGAEVDAMITAALLDTELERAPVAVLAGTLLTEARTIAIPGGPEAESLRVAVDDALAALRSSGTLSELSRRAFGVDLSEAGR